MKSQGAGAMTKRATLAGALLLVVGVAVGFVLLPAIRARSPGDLPSAERWVATQFPNVEHLPVTAITGADVVLVDVRPAREFAVSRLPGALSLPDPSSGTTLTPDLARQIAGKRVVLYCSVGYRSSVVAQALEAKLKAAGATSVANLRGGAFAWINSGRPLSDDRGETSRVHGFDRTWSRLVDPARATVVLD
jgi:rhodanese-related sulfurtransferase